MNEKTDIQLIIEKDPDFIQKINRAIQTRRKILGKVGSFEHRGAERYNQGRNFAFTRPPYDLEEISRAADVEPYVAQSIKRHREMILKEGFELNGSDDEMVDYVKDRLFEIELITDITTEQWLREFVTNFVMSHTSFLVFRRDRTRSSGGRIRRFGRTLDPIAGIFVPAPSTMEVQTNEYGQPLKWKQRFENLNSTRAVNKRNNEFSIDDVVIATMDKKSGYTFGTPYILPVLDDIRVLRRLEELVVVLSSKEAFPLYHYKIGTENKPAQIYDDGTAETDQALAQVAGMPAQGFIVTSERYEIKLVSKSGASLNLEPFLKYFEDRVLAGLRLSELDLGRSGAASKGTASNINKNLEDACKDYQQVISDIITKKLILPICLEGGFDVTRENLVRFEFPMINREEHRARQTHGLSLYQANAITIDEFRKEYLIKKPFTEEDVFKTSRSIDSMIDAYFAPYINPPTPSASSSSGSGVQNTVSNRVQPENQYGKLPTKSRFTANDHIEDYIDSLKNNITLITSRPEVEEEDIANLHCEFSDFINKILESDKEDMISYIEQGRDKALQDYSSVKNITQPDVEKLGNRAIAKFSRNFLFASYWTVGKTYLDQISKYLKKDSNNNSFITTCLLNADKFRTNLLKLREDQKVVSYRFGYAKMAKRLGYKEIIIENKKNNSQNIIDISNIQYKNLLPKSLEEEVDFSFEENKKIGLPKDE